MFNRKATVAAALIAAVAASGGCGSGDDEGPPGPQKTIWVAGQKERCDAAGARECYLVKDSPDGEWTLFYDEIAGFDYDEGYEYEIVVAEVEVETADVLSKRWTLVGLVRKTDASLLLPAGALAGPEWSLRAFDVAGAEQPLVAGTEITLALDADGKIAGTGGCNRYFGTYESGAGGIVSFGAIGSTRMACPTEIMDQEQRFFRTLEAATAYVAEGEELEISGGEEASLLFTRVEPSAE
jgi:heat shock protein HslJ